MDVNSAIENRVTSYHFSDKDVSEEMVVNIIESAVKAPVAGGVREYEFIIITGKEGKKQLSELSMTPNIDSAPFIVVVVCDKTKLEAVFDDKDSETFCVENVSLAIENMLLTATSLGLGSAWISTLKQEPINKSLNIPANYIVRGVIPMGYTAEQGTKKKNPAVDISKLVHLEKFNNNAE